VTQVAQEQIGLGTGIEFDVEKTKRTLKKV
jgi:hypothetical protein